MDFTVKQNSKTKIWNIYDNTNLIVTDLSHKNIDFNTKEEAELFLRYIWRPAAEKLKTVLAYWISTINYEIQTQQDKEGNTFWTVTNNPKHFTSLEEAQEHLKNVISMRLKIIGI